MSDLAQVVCTQNDGEFAVALTPFLPLPEVRTALADFQAEGCGDRQKDRPKLELLHEVNFKA